MCYSGAIAAAANQVLVKQGPMISSSCTALEGVGIITREENIWCKIENMDLWKNEDRKDVSECAMLVQRHVTETEGTPCLPSA
jgi:hypothetical protein